MDGLGFVTSGGGGRGFLSVWTPRLDRSICRNSMAPANSSTVVCAATSSDRRDWASAGGIQNDRLRLHTFPGGLRGMQATEDLKPNEVLITVPKGMVIEANSTPDRNPIPSFVKSSFWRKEVWWVRLAVLLLYQKYSRSNEYLQGYVEALPKSFPTPFHWSDEKLLQTQYRQIQKQVLRQRKVWTEIHRRFLDGHLGREPIGLDEFVWALECVRSRAFSGAIETTSIRERIKTFAFAGTLAVLAMVLKVADSEEALNGLSLVVISLMAYDVIYPRVMKAVQGEEAKRYILCPVVDFCNHKSRVKSDLSYEYFYERFVLKTEAFSKGEQVFISYGQRSNDQLVQFYGFVEEDNPDDVYVFGAELGDVLRSIGVDVSEKLSSTEMAVGPVVLLRSPLGFNETVQKTLESLLGSKDRVEAVLKDLCEHALEAMETTLEEDLELKRRPLEVAFRIEKKKMLKLALEQSTS